MVPKMFPSENSALNGVFFKEQAEALHKHGNHKVGVLAINVLYLGSFFNYKNRKLSPNKQKINNVIIYTKQLFNIPKLEKLNAQIRFWHLKMLFRAYIRDFGLPDILHLHIFEGGQFANYVKRKYNINYIVTEHFSYIPRGLVSDFDIKRATETYKNSSYNIAVSKKFAEFLTSYFNIGFKYIPNLIDTEFFSLKPPKKTPGCKTFINIGNLNKNKNQLMLLRAFEMAFGKQKGYKLIIVGSGTEKEKLENEIAKLEISKQVSLFGTADRKTIKELLHNSDYYVHSSIYETFGIALIEAMSCGLPVVSTKNGGSESIVTDDKLGVLCDPEINDICQALKSIAQTEFDGQYIRNNIINNFSEEKVIKRLSEIYQKFK